MLSIQSLETFSEIKMLHVSGLIPTRFLAILSHLILTLTLLMSREDNIIACLPIGNFQERSSYIVQFVIMSQYHNLRHSEDLLLLELHSFIKGVPILTKFNLWPHIIFLNNLESGFLSSEVIGGQTWRTKDKNELPPDTIHIL